MKKWLCIICGWVYDEAKGWPNDGIAPGTKWEDIPDDWLCPDCLVTKADFEMIELVDDEDEENEVAPIAIQTIEALEPIVIIGSGHAGYQLAAELRQQSPNISITIFTEDDGALYSKPALSNAFALKKSSEDLVRETALEWERRLNIRLYPHTKVQRIDRESKFIETNIGRHHYGQLVLATGAKPINIDIKGKCTDIVNVNSLMDYSKFRDNLSGKNHITILGDGLIGCEFANDLAANGYQVSVVGLGHWAMHRLIPEDLGIVLQSALSELGVDWYLKNTIESVSPDDGQYQVTLQNGEVFTTDIILSAIGLKPNTELALTASLDVGIGIKTNLEYRSSDSCIFAIGDCAEVDGQWQPYIQPINQAIPVLVKTLLGKPTSVEVTYSPVLVKTPILPLSVLMIGGKGSWEIHTASNDGWSASFLDDRGKLKGFALLGHGLQQQRNDWLIKIQS